MSESEPIRVKLVRSRIDPRGVFVDANLDIVPMDRLREWAAKKVDFIVVDEATGDDITRILLA